MSRINPRVDFAFKKLFGSEENKDLLISLVNSILPEDERVAKLELKNPYNLADYRAGKISILDIKACDYQGRWFNIEMQIGEDRNFDKRAIYYWSKLVTEQLSEGHMYKELKKTVSINILDFNFLPGDEHTHTLYRIMNTRTGKPDRLHDIFELHYLELRKFRKSFSEIATGLDRWMTFLTRAHEMDRRHLPQEIEADTAIVKAIEAVDRMFNEEERVIYETRMQAFANMESRIASAVEEALLEGREEGREEGQNIERWKMVRAASQSGLSVDEIVVMFKLGQAEVERVLADSKAK